MYEYEINVAKNGRHTSLIKLGRVTEGEAIEEARFYRQHLGRDNESLSFTLYRVPVKVSERVEF